MIRPAARAGLIPRRILWIVSAFAAVSAVLFNPYIGLASGSYGLLAAGLWYRKNREFHVRAMASGMISDLLLVLFLEATRHAVYTATHSPLSAVQYAHILFSTAAVVFYAPLFVTGFKMYRGDFTLARRQFHLRIGLTAFGLRTAGFLTMFSMLGKG